MTTHNELYLAYENPNGCPDFAERQYNAELLLRVCCGDRGARYIMRTYGGKNLVLDAVAVMDGAHEKHEQNKAKAALSEGKAYQPQAFHLSLDDLVVNGKPLSEADKAKIAQWQGVAQAKSDQQLSRRIARERATEVGPDGEDDTAHLKDVFQPHELLGGRPCLRVVPNPSHAEREEARNAGISSGMLRL